MRETSLDDFIGGADEDEAEEPEAPDEVEDSKSDELAIGGSTADNSVADESEADGSVIDEPDGPEVEDSESDPAPDTVEPAVSTYDWTPTGADCEACGTTVEKRWRDDGRLVCPDCKAW